MVAPFSSCSQRIGQAFQGASSVKNRPRRLASRSWFSSNALVMTNGDKEKFLVARVCSCGSKLDWFMPVFKGVYCSRRSQDGLYSILSINKFKLAWIRDQIRKGEILLEVNSQPGWLERAIGLTRVGLRDGAGLGTVVPQLDQLGRELGRAQEKVKGGWAGQALGWAGFRPKPD
jgi:hypothetical protein